MKETFLISFDCAYENGRVLNFSRPESKYAFFLRPPLLSLFSSSSAILSPSLFPLFPSVVAGPPLSPRAITWLAPIKE